MIRQPASVVSLSGWCCCWHCQDGVRTASRGTAVNDISPAAAMHSAGNPNPESWVYLYLYLCPTAPTYGPVFRGRTVVEMGLYESQEQKSC